MTKKYVIQRKNETTDEYEYLLISNPQFANKPITNVEWVKDFIDATMYEDSDLVSNNRGWVYGHQVCIKMVEII